MRNHRRNALFKDSDKEIIEGEIEKYANSRKYFKATMAAMFLILLSIGINGLYQTQALACDIIHSISVWFLSAVFLVLLGYSAILARKFLIQYESQKDLKKKTSLEDQEE
jgi:membrane protein implicated in regulation of membrane protease activity